MDNPAFAAVVRRAAEALSRRAALIGLGGAAFAAVAASPASAKAGMAGKNARRRCQRQGRQCRTSVLELCDANNLNCEAVLPCCDFFARCQAPEGIRCIFEEPPGAPEL